MYIEEAGREEGAGGDWIFSLWRRVASQARLQGGGRAAGMIPKVNAPLRFDVRLRRMDGRRDGRTEGVREKFFMDAIKLLDLPPVPSF